MAAPRKKSAARKQTAADGQFAKSLETRRKPKVEKASRVSDKLIMKWAASQAGKDLPRHHRDQQLPAVDPVVELTPRAPHGPQGHMDLLWAGRWDTTYNLIFMRPIVHGDSPGEWDGSVAYVRLKAPTSGSFVVAAVFAGFGSPQGGQGLILRMHGPWGTASVTGQSTEPGGPIAIWNADAGDTLSFTVNCSGGVIAYLQSIRLYPLG